MVSEMKMDKINRGKKIKRERESYFCLLSMKEKQKHEQVNSGITPFSQVALRVSDRISIFARLHKCMTTL